MLFSPRRFAPRRSLVGLGLAAFALPAAPAHAAPPAPVSVMPPGPETLQMTLAGGSGRLVATRPRSPRGSELVELVAGQAPRVVRRFGGRPSQASVGRDERGNVVAVLSPCATYARDGLPKSPRCSLRMVRLDDGRERVVPRSAGAYAGAVDGQTAVVARRSPSVGTRLAYLPASGRSKSLPLDAVARFAFRDDELPPTRVVTGLDLEGSTVAATVEVTAGAGYSALIVSVAGRPWKVLERSGYGEASGTPRVFRAPGVTPKGVRAFYDGGDNDAGWVGRWSRSGKRLQQVFTRRYGVPLIDTSVAWQGNRLVVDNCYTAYDDGACTVTSHGPLPLR